VLGVGASGPVGEAEVPTELRASAKASTRTPAPSPAGLSEREAWAVLVSVVGLGPVGFGALLRRFGTGLAILERAVRPGGVAALLAAVSTTVANRSEAPSRQPLRRSHGTRIRCSGESRRPVSRS
jgi:hypothetical protein